MGDEEKAGIIMALDVPQHMKEIGDQIQNFDEERWEEACQGIVERGNMEKVFLKKKCKEGLLSHLIEIKQKLMKCTNMH